jgi:hypothetical protein
MLVEDSIRLIHLKIDHQHDAKEEKENKIQGFSKNIPASWTYSSDRVQLRFILVKVQIHTLSNDLRGNLF